MRALADDWMVDTGLSASQEEDDVVEAHSEAVATTIQFIRDMGGKSQRG